MTRLYLTVRGPDGSILVSGSTTKPADTAAHYAGPLEQGGFVNVDVTLEHVEHCKVHTEEEAIQLLDWQI